MSDPSMVAEWKMTLLFFVGVGIGVFCHAVLWPLLNEDIRD